MHLDGDPKIPRWMEIWLPFLGCEKKLLQTASMFWLICLGGLGLTFAKIFSNSFYPYLLASCFVRIFVAPFLVLIRMDFLLQNTSIPNVQKISDSELFGSPVWCFFPWYLFVVGLVGIYSKYTRFCSWLVVKPPQLYRWQTPAPLRFTDVCQGSFFFTTKQKHYKVGRLSRSLQVELYGAPISRVYV